MIPVYLDDGFTTELQAGGYARPVLYEDAVRLKNQSASLTFMTLKGSPYSWAVPPHGQDEMVRACLTYSAEQEEKDLNDLIDSVNLHVNVNQGMSELDCDTCRTYCTDHQNGEVYLAASGHPLPLPKNTKLPCETHLGCPKRHYSNPLGLSVARWARCVRHYWMFRNDFTHELTGCPIWNRNRLLLDWVFFYARDPRFYPFVGRGTRRRSTSTESETLPRQAEDGAGCAGGGCPGRACGAECSAGASGDPEPTACPTASC